MTGEFAVSSRRQTRRPSVMPPQLTDGFIVMTLERSVILTYSLQGASLDGVGRSENLDCDQVGA